MKKFLRNLGIFSVIILALNFIVFVFANDNYYKDYKNIPDKKFHSFIIADSHGLGLENFGEKYGVYNFSTSSDSYLDMKRKITYLIENKYDLKTIYLTVDGHTMSPYRDRFNNSDKTIAYTSDINYNYLKEKYLKYYFPLFQVKINPLLRIYLVEKTKKIFRNKKDSSDRKIWNDLSNTERLKIAEGRVAGQFPTSEGSENLAQIVEEIIQLCKQNNIELVGLKFPLSDAYLEKMGNKNYGADHIFIKNGLKVINHESIFKNKDENFKDEDHINQKGGKEFVEILLKK